MNFFVHSIIMSEKTLKFNDIKIHKKEFHKSEQAIDLDSIITDKIVVCAYNVSRIFKRLIKKTLC